MQKKELTILLLRCSLDAGSDEVGSGTHSALKIDLLQEQINVLVLHVCFLAIMVIFLGVG